MSTKYIVGGTVVTMDPARRVLPRATLRLEGGRITGIGVRRPRYAHTIDARGAWVIPGLVQAHVHLCQALFRGLADDLPLLPWLASRIWPLEGAHDRASLRASARLGAAEMIRGGTTCILDMGTVHHQDVIFEVLASCGLRGFSGKAMMDVGDGVPASLREDTAASLAESARLCERWHGAEDGRLGYAYAPRFVLSCTPRLLREAARAARTAGARIHSHAAEHAEERAAVKDALGTDDIAALASLGIAGPDVLLAHGVQLRRAEMRAMARAGTRVVHCPSANLKLASGIADVRAMRDAGMVVGLGADGAPCNNRMDIWTELRQAALLAKGLRRDATALRAEEAFALATVEGARALGWEAEIGSLELGKRADLAIVRADALHQLPGVEAGGDVYGRLVYATTPADVRWVLVDGRALLEDGALTTLDEPKVAAAAKRQAKRVVRRADLG